MEQKLVGGKSMDKISIILPVYNGEKYLAECLDSLIEQSYNNFEVLMVDDCSTDSSASILRRYELKDARFKYLRNSKNMGLSFSRNKGIESSAGSFLFFIDADDTLSTNCLKLLYDSLKSNNADISMCCYVTQENEFTNVETQIGEIVFNKNELINELSKCVRIQNFAWGKLYKKALFNAIRFPVGRYYEDICTTIQVFNNANRGVFMQNALYFYRQNPSSISKTLNLKKINDFFLSIKEKGLFIQKYYPQELKYMSQSFFELFYLIKKIKVSRKQVKEFKETKAIYKRAVKSSSFKQKIKYLIAVI